MSETLDMSQLKGLARDLKRVDPVLAREFGRALLDAGELVAGQARLNAEFSKRIPATIKVRRRGQSVRVQAGGPSAPHAGLFEYGSRDNPGTIRHPLFGNYDQWFSQPTHPFLAPAVEQTQELFDAQVLQAVDIAFAQVGF